MEISCFIAFYDLGTYFTTQLYLARNMDVGRCDEVVQLHQIN